MSSTTRQAKQELSELLAPCDQQHLLAHWESLSAADQSHLVDQIKGLDLDQIEQLVREEEAEEDIESLAARAEPPPAVRPGEGPSDEAARRRGEAALAQGTIGCVLVAGGQGSRLGFEHPKGMFSVGPISGARLFQILIEKIVATRRRYGSTLPLYIMTSPATDAETRSHLAEQNYYGLPADDVIVFCQGTMPAVNAADGKLLLSAAGEIFESPDGHGGMLAAMDRSGALADMERRGIEQLFYFQVDNPLAQVADSVFLGHHLLHGSEYSLQAVVKETPTDRVGNVVSIDDAVRIIEYSDLPAAAGARRNADGSLSLWAGSIAVHVFDVAFLKRIAGEGGGLSFHRAVKKVPYVDASGTLVDPESANAIKFEQFIFDLLPKAERPLVVEVDAADAFSAVKNAAGAANETCATAQAAMTAQARRWLEAAGAEVAEGIQLEISPLYALDKSELAEKVAAGTAVDEDRYFR